MINKRIDQAVFYVFRLGKKNEFLKLLACLSLVTAFIHEANLQFMITQNNLILLLWCQILLSKLQKLICEKE